MRRLSPLLFVSVLACGPGASSPEPAPSGEEGAGAEARPEVAAAARCTVRIASESGDVDSEETFDLEGPLVVRSTSTAGATRMFYEEGRLVRTEGVDSPEPPATFTYEVDAEANTVTAREVVDGIPARTVTWTYDADGRPVRQSTRYSIAEDSDEEPDERRTTCEYDELGRPVRSDDEGFMGTSRTMFEYASATGWSGRMSTHRGGPESEPSVDAISVDGSTIVVERHPRDREATPTLVTFEGACEALFFPEVCNPLKAPPPPSGVRATLPPPGG